MESFTDIKRAMFSGQTNEAHKTGDPEACIMIIDDDLDISEALTSLLQARYRLISCSSFGEAMQKLTPDIKLVLLDIKMASKDGIDVFKLLKEKQADLPIIFHSAYPGSSEKVAEVGRLNHNGYVTKGEYDLSELLTTIDQARNQSAGMSSISPERTTNKPTLEEK